MEKRYQVFVSSTYTDLKDERQVIIKTLLEMDCIPAGMELFPAIDEEQFEFIKHIIDDSDYYILIIGGKYGSETQDGISYTEKEYDYAINTKKKVIAFIYGSPENISVCKSEQDPIKKKKLEDFIEKVKNGRLVKFWIDISQLEGLVAINLNKTIKAFPADGWIRGTKEDFQNLKIENLELKQKLNEIQNTTKIINIPDLAEMTEQFEFSIKYSIGNKNEEMHITTDWNKLFSVIGQNILEFPEDENVQKALKTYFLEKNKPDGAIYRGVNIEILNMIKIQFMANGLIDQMGYSWDLTDEGRRRLLFLKAIRKKSSKE